MNLYLYDKSNDKRLQGEVFINQIFDENIRWWFFGKKFFGKKHFFAEKLFSLMKTSDIFVENLVNKKLLLAAFYHLTYQHDSKDFNICNYKPNLAISLYVFFFLVRKISGTFISWPKPARKASSTSNNSFRTGLRKLVPKNKNSGWYAFVLWLLPTKL